MDNLDAQIMQMQTQLTSALKCGEPENSPHMLQMDARLERMHRLWATHRQIRSGQQAGEVRDVSRVN